MRKECALLFLVGVCLSVAQFVMIRDFVAILYGEEVVIVLVTAAFFTGLSFGYLLSLRLSQTTFKYLFLASVFIHLTFPFSYRYLACVLSTVQDNGFAYLALMFGYALIFSSMFAAFLPQLIHIPDEQSTPVKRLKVFYSIELLGFLAGFALVGWSWNQPLSHLLMVYWLLLSMVLYLALGNKIFTGVFLVLMVWASIHLNHMDYQSAQMLYQHKHKKKDVKLLMSINSPYQKVEVLEDPNGGKYLYLDGLQNLNPEDLEILNYYIAKVPARLIKPKNALIVGNGTLSSVPKVYPHAQQMTSVELDAGVLLAGKRFFVYPESLKTFDRWTLFVDDGKHFLKTRKDIYDLIIMDIPSPLSVQEAVLHTTEFYRLARSRLNENGVIAVQLSGPLQKNNRTPARITCALSKAFKEIMVVDSTEGDRSFAYASDKLPFTVGDVRNITQSFEDEDSRKIIPPEEISSYLSEAVPLEIDKLDLVLRRGWERFFNRYFEDD